MSVSPSSGQTHLEAKCYHLLTVVIALPNLGFVTCFFFMSVNLCCNESLFQKYFYGLSFNDSIAISISEKIDSSGFKHFDLLGEFLPFL